MKWFAAVPLVISSLLMGAHFLRIGELALVVFSVAVPLLILTRHVIAIRTLQILLVLATAEWLRTAYGLTAYRSAMGVPVTRMLVILCAVATFTLLSAVPLGRIAGAGIRRQR